MIIISISFLTYKLVILVIYEIHDDEIYFEINSEEEKLSVGAWKLIEGFRK